MFTSQLVLPSAMTWTEKSACVANLPRSHKHTRARFVLLLWCCCIVVVVLLLLLPSLALVTCHPRALSSLVTCSERTKKRGEGEEKTKKTKNENDFCEYKKAKRTVLVAGRTKQRKNEKKTWGKKKERSKKQRKQKNSEGFPNKYFHRRQLRAKKG